MEIKATLKSLKEMFAAPAAPAAAPAAGAPPADAGASTSTPTPCSYPVDGGQPVFVDIADDGIPDIDQDDKVFSDSGMTTPYPDGTYKVTGTDFGFTVTGGAVTAVVDPDGKGAGTPMAAESDDEMAAFKADVANLKTEFEAHKQAYTQVQAEFTETKAQVGRQQEAITKLLEVVEQLAATPAADPAAPPKGVFKEDAKEAKRKEIFDAIQALKKK